MSRGRTARAIAYVACGEDCGEATAFELALDRQGACSVSVNRGVFSIETHNIPFSTGEPEPGSPAKFFGICDRGESVAACGDEAPISAELQGLGASNFWSVDDERVKFEFRGRASEHATAVMRSAAASRRSINNFTFKNTGDTDLPLIVRAYRAGAREVLYEVGSSEKPLRLAADAVYTVCAAQHYDCLELMRAEGGSESLSLSLEGYSEYAAADIEMSVAVAGAVVAGEVVGGNLEFAITSEGGNTPEVQFTGARSGAGPAFQRFDSVWDRLG